MIKEEQLVHGSFFRNVNQVFEQDSLEFGNVVVREVWIAVLLLPPRGTLWDRETDKKWRLECKVADFT